MSDDLEDIVETLRRVSRERGESSISLYNQAAWKIEELRTSIENWKESCAELTRRLEE